MLVDAAGNVIETPKELTPVETVINRLKTFSQIPREDTPEHREAARKCMSEAMDAFMETLDVAERARNGHDWQIIVRSEENGLISLQLQDMSPRGLRFLKAWEAFAQRFQQASLVAQLEEGIRQAHGMCFELKDALDQAIVRIAKLEMTP